MSKKGRGEYWKGLHLRDTDDQYLDSSGRMNLKINQERSFAHEDYVEGRYAAQEAGRTNIDLITIRDMHPRISDSGRSERVRCHF